VTRRRTGPYFASILLLFLTRGISDEDSDEEDETAELLRELEKIKRERAEEKARIEAEESATKTASREAEIATANPLLNLAAALGQAPGLNTTAPGTFQVKKRWDDGELQIPALVRCILTVGRLDFQEPGYQSAKATRAELCERSAADRVPQVRADSRTYSPPILILRRKFMSKFIKVWTLCSLAYSLCLTASMRFFYFSVIQSSPHAHISIVITTAINLPCLISRLVPHPPFSSPLRHLR